MRVVSRMQHPFAKIVSLALLGACVSAPALADQAAPVRTLTFSFTYALSKSTEVHNSGFSGNGLGGAGGGSGVDSYTHNTGDSGTISVVVQREEADKGLVLAITEHANNGHSTKATTCVTYGTGTVICDPNATVHPEEYTIMRFLGANFVDPALIDANRHWKVASNGAGFSASSDYTLGKPNGDAMPISETRTVTYQGGVTGHADVTSSIVYDIAKQVPLSIEETTMNHSSSGSQDSDQTVEVTAKLIADSMGAVPAK